MAGAGNRQTGVLSEVRLASVDAHPSPSAARGPIHLQFLDGMRGLAALYVLLYHTASLAGGPQISPLLHHAIAVLMHGHYAVSVFIVLSGYCLMLPVAVSANGQARGGVVGFLKRRARRILPPYYVALLFSLLIRGIRDSLQLHKGVSAPFHQDFNAGNLASHFLLYHNVSWDWAYSINVAFWSVATEWQIYFVFILLLLPCWRKLGVWSILALSFVIGVLPSLYEPFRRDYGQACFWYLFLFAMGMVGATVTTRLRDVERTRRSKRLWGWAAALTALTAFSLFQWAHRWAYENETITDLVVGSAITGLIVFCALAVALRSAEAEPTPFLLRFLERPKIVRLGAFSYSLYLVHFPIIAGFALLAQMAHLSAAATGMTLYFLGAPSALAFSYLFYLVVERRFVSTPSSVSRPSASVGV